MPKTKGTDNLLLAPEIEFSYNPFLIPIVKLTDNLLRFAASQFNAQYSFLSGNSPQKRLANILLSTTKLKQKQKAVNNFRNQYTQHAPLMEKIIISLVVNFEIVSK